MKTVIIERKNGKTTIEMPDDASIIEVLAEHEIVNYKILSITSDQTTGTIRFEELKDKMKVYMVMPWWSPNFLTATVTEHWDNSGFHIETNRKVQGHETFMVVKNQKDLDKGCFVISRSQYKKDEKQANLNAEKHAAHLLSLTGKKSWNEYFFPFEEAEKQTDE